MQQPDENNFPWHDDWGLAVDSTTFVPPRIDEKKLHEKNLDEVLTGIAKGDQRIFTDYYDTVQENYAIIDGIQKLFEYLAESYKIESYNYAVRGITIHGFEIYKFRIGHQIEQSFKNQHQWILQRDRRILGGDSCNINLDECGNKHTSFSLDTKISGALGGHSRRGCIPKYKLVTLCMCYSLSTYPDITGWQDVIQSNIRKFEKAQRERMGIE